MTREEILDRLRKMKQLADRGVGGERENAERLLAEIAAQYGINLADLEGERLEYFSVTLKESWKRKMLSQLCALKRQELKRDGVSLANYRMAMWTTTKKKSYSVSNCTKAEWLELMAKLEVLSRAYKRQLDDFYEAFLMANDLLVEPDDDKQQKEPSREERSRLFRAVQMSMGIEKSQLNKQLTFG